MSFKKKGILVAFTLAAASGLGIAGYTAYKNSPIEYSSPTGSDAAFEQCAHAAVTSEFPNMKGGFVEAKNRAPGYNQFGDMLHYRDRSLNSAQSVSVNKAEDGTAEIYMLARKGLVVLPESMFPYLSAKIEDAPRQFYVTQNDRSQPTSDDNGFHARATRVSDNIAKCGLWK